MTDSDRSDELDVWIAETAPRALAFALTLVRNRADAEDLVQDCYGRLLAKADEYDLPREGTKLLFRAISNACINWTQRRPPVVSLNVTEPAKQSTLTDRSGLEPERQAERHELERAIAAALADLPPTQRAVVELRSLGHSLVEVAEMLDLSAANARVVLHRARQTLAVRLRPFLEENVA